MSIAKVYRDVFSFMMVGLLLMLASEETKVIDTPVAQQAKAIHQSTRELSSTNQSNWSNPNVDKCFDVNFPIQILSPNGEIQQVNSDIALNELLVEWFEKNPNSNSEPTFAYPFAITYHDGSVKRIDNEGQFLSIADACDQQTLNDNFASVNSFCFDFIYPIQLKVPNGQMKKVAKADELDAAMLDWSIQNPNSMEGITIHFPIKIKFNDGVIIDLEELNDLSAAIQYCEDELLETDENIGIEANETTPRA